MVGGTAAASPSAPYSDMNSVDMNGGDGWGEGAGEGWETLGDAGMQMLEACGGGKLEQVRTSPGVQHPPQQTLRAPLDYLACGSSHWRSAASVVLCGIQDLGRHLLDFATRTSCGRASLAWVAFQSAVYILPNRESGNHLFQSHHRGSWASLLGGLTMSPCCTVHLDHCPRLRAWPLPSSPPACPSTASPNTFMDPIRRCHPPTHILSSVQHPWTAPIDFSDHFTQQSTRPDGSQHIHVQTNASNTSTYQCRAVAHQCR